MPKVLAWFVGVGVLSHAAALAAWAANDVPLPHDVTRLPAPVEVQVGSTTLEVQGFATALDEQAAIAFYEQALSKSGWQRDSLPWQASHAKTTERLERYLQYHPDDPQAESLKKRLKELKHTKQLMRAQMYASRGGEHVIINAMPAGQGTMVFINRWRGDRSWMEGPPTDWGTNRGKSQSVGGQMNVCCSGERVPDTALPVSVPRYPGARAIASGRSKGTTSSTTVLMTQDQVEEVREYYRSQMWNTGWELVEETEALPESGVGGHIPPPTVTRATGHLQLVGGHTLSFRKGDRLCRISIEGGVTASAAEQTLITIAIAPKPQERSAR